MSTVVEESPLTNQNYSKYQSDHINSLWIFSINLCAHLFWDEKQHNIDCTYNGICGWQRRTQSVQTGKRPQKSRLPGYLAALEPGCGCPWLDLWLFEIPLFVLAPGRLSPPNDQVVCPASSPVSVLLVCDQTPLSDLLFPIPAGPATQWEATHIKASHYVMLHYFIVSDLSNNILIHTLIFVLKVHSVKPHL